MKKGTKFGVFIIIGLILISTLSIVSAAEDSVQGNFIQKIGEIFDNLSRDIAGGDTNYEYLQNILSAQILFGILIFLVVFAVVKHIPMFNRNGIAIPISIVIGLLSAGFIDPRMLAPLLNQYQAIGVTITFIIPFIFIFYFIKETFPHSTLFSKIVWITYAIVLGISYILNFPKIRGGDWITNLLYLAAMAGSIFMAIFSVRIYNRMFQDEIRSAFATQQQLSEMIRLNRVTEAVNTYNAIHTNMTSSQRTNFFNQIVAMNGGARPPGILSP